MKHLSAYSIGLTVILLALLAGCSKRDPVVNVEDNHPDMVAAIARARESLPHFWEVFEKRSRGESHFSLKVKITDPRGTEHFWTTEIERRDGRIMGTINNEPRIVSSVKLGDRLEIPEADISDWLYMRDGKMVGNETLKALFTIKNMPAAEVERFKNIMADP